MPDTTVTKKTCPLCHKAKLLYDGDAFIYYCPQDGCPFALEISEAVHQLRLTFSRQQKDETP